MEGTLLQNHLTPIPSSPKGGSRSALVPQIPAVAAGCRVFGAGMWLPPGYRLFRVQRKLHRRQLKASLGTSWSLCISDGI